MLPDILSSPLLSIPTIDYLLSHPTASDPAHRIQLLSSKIYLLQQTSQTTSKQDIQCLSLRIDLAESYLRLIPPDFHSAETEVMMVDEFCRKFSRRIKQRLNQSSPPRPHISTQDIDQVAGSGIKSKSTKTEFKGDNDAGFDETMISKLRIQALNVMVQVEEGLGRQGRAKRTRSLLDQLQQDILVNVSHTS